MNLIEKEERLKDLIEHNIKNEQFGTAIAITGSWGVGKTFFWKKFLDKQLSDERIFKKDNVFNRKYAYVSLFGLESLSDVKTHIYSSIESYHSSIEIPKWIKSLPSIFKDTRIAQLGINAPVKLIDSLMFAQVKDAIICFDDFERLSNKLDIKDVMGLANYLKLEKNCQVILILDEDKAESDNKQKYANYKEKLVDDVIIINSVEPLIRANTQDIDESLVEMMIKFAEELEIHNFRFFQKVIKLYREFRSKLPENVADSTKQVILTRILQGYLILNYGSHLKIGWEDFTAENFYEISDKEEHELDDKKRVLSKLNNLLYPSIIDSDGWFVQFKKWFEQKDVLDITALHDLANSELIDQENNKNREKMSVLMYRWRNLDVDSKYCEDLYDLSKQMIALENIGNLYFYCELLKEFGRIDLSRKLKREIKDWLVNSLNRDFRAIFNQISDISDRKNNGFCRYVEYYKNFNPKLGLPSLYEVMSRYLINKGWNDSYGKVLELASKQDWDDLIWYQLPHNPEFIGYSKKSVIHEIFNQRINRELKT